MATCKNFLTHLRRHALCQQREQSADVLRTRGRGSADRGRLHPLTATAKANATAKATATGPRRPAGGQVDTVDTVQGAFRGLGFHGGFSRDQGMKHPVLRVARCRLPATHAGRGFIFLKEAIERFKAGRGFGVPGGGSGGFGLALGAAERFGPEIERIGRREIELGEGFSRQILDARREGIERGLARGEADVRARLLRGRPAQGAFGIVLGRGKGGIAAGRIAPAQFGEVFVEARGNAGGGLPFGKGLFGMGIEPGEMGQQQTRIEVHAAAHRLTPVEDRLLGAVERAFCEHFLRRIARENQRGTPPGRKGPVAPLVDIGGLRRDADGLAGAADIAGAGEEMEKAHAAIRGEGQRRHKPRPQAGGVGVGRGKRGASFKPTPDPSRRREGRRRPLLTRKPDIAIPGDPPPPETAGAVLRHGHATPVWNKAGSLWHGWGCVGKSLRPSLNEFMHILRPLPTETQSMTIEYIAAKAAETVALQVIDRASPKILSNLAGIFSEEIRKIQVQFTKTFQNHLTQTFERSECIKTIISKDKPVPLEKIYVNLTLYCNDDRGLPDVSADPTQRNGCRFVLSGTGGAGKTVLLKHLLNISKQNSLGFVPIFVELRNIDFDSGEDMATCIFDEITKSGTKESYSLFQAALNEGLFALYLDGFDEIHPDQSTKALRFMRNFSDKYRSVSILISTRPQTGAATLQGYTVFHLEPLDKNQAIDLIERTDFDQNTKVKFLDRLNEELYDKHPTLMSLPILLAMMLYCFRTYADIPDRMTVFYGQSFETLYSIHDSENKELYKRTHHAGLAPDVFKTVLQAFSYLSLSNHDIEFTEFSLADYIKRSLSISNINVDYLKYKNDLIHNVCIIQPDGLSYVFAHRSFQEYFAAQFALNYSGRNRFLFFDRIISVAGSGVGRMMLEIDDIKTKRYWLVPKLEQIISALNKHSKEPLYKRFRLFYDRIYIEEGGDNHPVFSWETNSLSVVNYMVIQKLGEILGLHLGYMSIAANLLPFTEAEIRRYATPWIEDDAQNLTRGTIIRIQNPSGSPSDHDEYVLNKFSNPLLVKTGFGKQFSAYIKKISKSLEITLDELRNQSAMEDSELLSYRANEPNFI